mmetsp:Transcript_28336/g.39016  ORF Transcript_28336/g.39016 Transcript_28336/m.39016 type:complete len:268 (+) Transcript_28336:5161-5964(+)
MHFQPVHRHGNHSAGRQVEAVLSRHARFVPHRAVEFAVSAQTHAEAGEVAQQVVQLHPHAVALVIPAHIGLNLSRPQFAGVTPVARPVHLAPRTAHFCEPHPALGGGHVDHRVGVCRSQLGQRRGTLLLPIVSTAAAADGRGRRDDVLLLAKAPQNFPEPSALKTLHHRAVGEAELFVGSSCEVHQCIHEPAHLNSAIGPEELGVGLLQQLYPDVLDVLAARVAGAATGHAGEVVVHNDSLPATTNAQGHCVGSHGPAKTATACEHV